MDKQYKLRETILQNITEEHKEILRKEFEIQQKKIILEKDLENAIDQENFELCGSIQDEIKILTDKIEIIQNEISTLPNEIINENNEIVNEKKSNEIVS